MAARRFSKSFCLAALCLALFAGCAGAKKKTTPELGNLTGKKVALVEILGEPTSVQVVEVALVNQLIARGTFELVSKKAVDAAKADPSVDTTDVKAIAKKAGADYALRVRIADFATDVTQGYSTEEVEDSQLKAERGDGKTERLYKVKAMEGRFEAELTFVDLTTGETRSGTAKFQDKAESSEKTSAAKLPLRLSFLSKLANEAFKRFFDEYN
jgi:hypothetical protein